MGLRDAIHSIGRAIEPCGPEVYDYNHCLGWYADEDHRRQARFSDGSGYSYSPYYDEYFDDDDEDDYD